jgi:carboxyl-terminal processing protease
LIKETTGFKVQLDATAAKSGAQSLKIASTVEAPTGFQSVTQNCPVQISGPTLLHLRAAVKTRNPTGVALWCQIWDDQKMIGFANSQSLGNKPSGAGEWQELELPLLLKPTTRRLVFGAYLAGKGEAWFDDLRFEASPAAGGPPSAQVKAYLNKAIAIVQQNALVQDSIPWAQTQAEMMSFASGMQQESEAHVIVDYLLGILRLYGDNHSSFKRPQAAMAYKAEQVAGEPPKPEARYLAEGIGYIAVPSFASVNNIRSLNFATDIQRLIQTLDTNHTVSGWIVDLRNNGGGNMYPMIAGLGPLLGDATLGYFVKGKYEVPWAYRKGEAYNGKPGGTMKVETPYQLRNQQPRVAVLIGPRTASSGEMTAISFLGRPATRFFGAPTAGYTTANQGFELPDGAKINLAVSVTADRNHKKYPQRLTPDEEVKSHPQDTADQPLEAAKAWLANK